MTEIKPVDDGDRRLVRRGWWFVVAPATIASIGIVWVPIALFGLNMSQWSMTQIEIEFGFFAIAFLVGLAWRRWASPRWSKWAFSRAKSLDEIKVRAMIDGVIPKDKAFLRQIAEGKTPGSKAWP